MKKLIMVCFFVPMNMYAMEEFPQAIKNYRDSSWIVIEVKAEIREELQASLPTRINTLQKRFATLNLNDRKSDTFGRVSPLFDITHDDELLPECKEQLKLGASPNFACQTGHTPFEHAIRNNSFRIAYTMIEHGADCKKGLNVLLDRACYTQKEKLFFAQEALFNALLSKIKTVNYTDAAEQTPLMKIAQIKLAGKTKIEVPLHYRKFFARSLIEKGADITLRDCHGKTAIDIATRNNLDEFAAYLASSSLANASITASSEK